MPKDDDEMAAALASLTDQEREAYLEGQKEDADTTTTQGDAEDAAKAAAEAAAAAEGKDDAATTKTDADGSSDDVDAAAAAAATADDAASAAAAAAAATEQAAKAPPAAPAQPAPAFVAEAPADAAAKLDQITADKAALAAKWDAGDVSAVEYQTSLDALYKQERKIEGDVLKHQIASEMATQQKMAAWNAECNQFMTAHPEYMVGTPIFDKLNSLVKALGSDGSRSDSQALALAHQMVQLEAGTYVPPTTQAKPVKAPAGEKPALPPSLAGLPAATVTNPGESRWSALDRLTGEAYESALAKLSEADRDAYMKS